MDWTEYNTQGLKSKYLFKFISEKNLKRFINSGNIWFSRSDLFGDKMECVRISDLEKNPPNFNAIEKRKKRHLISCLHYGLKETLAFWDTYAKTEEDRRKYALRFDRIKFIELIKNSLSVIDLNNKKNLIHGRVKYKNLIGSTKENLKDNAVKFPSFRKEYVFSYEREYRFVIELKSEVSSKGCNINLGKISELPFCIFINPLLENSDYIKCSDLMKEWGIEKYVELSTLTAWLKPELW